VQSAKSVKSVAISSPEIQDRVKRLSEQLRQAYIDYIGDISRTQPRDWWRTSVSEKNPYISKTFFYACCIEACREYLAGDDVGSRAVLRVDDPELRRALDKNLRRAGLSARLSGPKWYWVWTTIRELTRIPLYQIYFLRHATKILYARYRYRLHLSQPVQVLKGTPVCLTNTWVDLRAYSLETGEFKDADFADLTTYLRSKGHSVAGLASISFEGASYGKVVRYIAQSNVPYLVPHAFLRLRDLITCLWRSFVKIPKRRKYPAFAGLEISDFIFGDLLREWTTQRDADHFLVERWVERFKEAGIVIGRFIYTFENHTWERVICNALRTAYPPVRLIGYQPNGLPLMLLNYFISNSESQSIPLPDRIVANGPYTAELLSSSGYGSNRVVLGGGLRQSYLQPVLYRGNGASVRPRPNGPRILVTPSIGRSSTVELIRKVLRAFDRLSKMEIILKCHPSIQFERMKPHLGSVHLPPHFRVSVEPLMSLLPTADLLIYNDGTFPAAEALAFGIPVIFVEPDCGLSFDSLDGFPHVRRTARTPEKIAELALEILNSPESGSLKTEGLAAVRQLVGEVTERTFELFAG